MEINFIDLQLENILDNAGLSRLLERLAIVCHEKADHLRTNWQDYGAAKNWDDAGSKIAHEANQFEVG